MIKDHNFVFNKIRFDGFKGKDVYKWLLTLTLNNMRHENVIFGTNSYKNKLKFNLLYEIKNQSKNLYKSLKFLEMT